VPFLRVIRDKRGYETTYLMHWYREGSRQRSRILYVFRTPGGVRVGRDALDPQVLRQLEARHPDIDFDWDVVRDNQQVIEPPFERRRRARREDGEAPAPAPAPAPAQAASPPPVPPPEKTGAVAQPPRPPVPSAIQGASLDEQMAFLAHWYPLVRERVAARVADPSRRDALLLLAERLNASSWTDADQITTGLQDAAESLERLSRVFSKRRRRPRKRGAPALEGSASPDDSGSDDGAADGPEGPEPPSSDH
jgi:hypothetical protein